MLDLCCVSLQEGFDVDVCLNCVIQCVSLQEGLNAARTIPKQVTQVSHSVTLRGRRGRRPGTGYMRYARKTYEKDIRERYMRKIYEKEKGEAARDRMYKMYEKDIREREGGWGRGPET